MKAQPMSHQFPPEQVNAARQKAAITALRLEALGLDPALEAMARALAQLRNSPATFAAGMIDADDAATLLAGLDALGFRLLPAVELADMERPQ